MKDTFVRQILQIVPLSYSLTDNKVGGDNMNFEAQMKNLEKQIKAATDGTYSVEEVVNDEFVRKILNLSQKKNFSKRHPKF